MDIEFLIGQMTRGLSGLISDAVRGAFLWTILIIVPLVTSYELLSLAGLLPSSNGVLLLVPWWILIYLILIGLLGGAVIGLLRGIRKGTKKALLANSHTENLYRSIFTHSLQGVRNFADGRDSIVAKMITAL